jgi:hypothetical protein
MPIFGSFFFETCQFSVNRYFLFKHSAVVVEYTSFEKKHFWLEIKVEKKTMKGAYIKLDKN